MSGDLRAAPGRLEDLAGLLGVSLAQWAYRDTAADKPAARQAANVAVDAIDAMMRELYRVRQQLVTEIRAADDAEAARADELLARLRREREEGGDSR